MSTSSWTFLSHHGHTFLCLARDPDTRLRDVADAVGLTERTVQAIVNDLVAEGYVTRTRHGRRNHYEIHSELPLRHRLQREIDVGTLLRLLDTAGKTPARRERRTGGRREP